MVDSHTFEKLKAIPDKEWGRIYKELTLYGELKLRIFGFEVRTEKDAVDAEAFAAQAIEKLFDGSRKWDSERFPDLLIHLKGVVKSLLSNHFKTSSKSVVRVKTDRRDPGDESADMPEMVEINEGLEIFDDSPEEIIITSEKWKEIEASFGKDENGFVIFSDWLDGYKPSYIADIYGFNIKDVYNSIRNGKRNVKSLYEKR